MLNKNQFTQAKKENNLFFCQNKESLQTQEKTR